MSATAAQVYAYWHTNTSLNATPIFVGMAPPTTVFPYCVITTISSVPQYSSGLPYHEDSHFSLSIYHTSLATAHAIADTVDAQFTGQTITSGGMICFRENQVEITENHTNQFVYAIHSDFRLLQNKTR